jgi:hypothetical protein
MTRVKDTSRKDQPHEPLGGPFSHRRHLSPGESALPADAPPLFACMTSPAMLPAAEDVAPDPLVAPLSPAVKMCAHNQGRRGGVRNVFWTFAARLQQR